MRPLQIRIEGASSPFPIERLEAGVAVLRAAGHDVDDRFAGPNGRHAYLNGDDNHRRNSLQDALRSDVDVVVMARGGYGLTRIVDDLFIEGGWPQRLPLVVGFSDVTALFARFAVEGRLDRCIHGPLATNLAGEPEHARARFFAALAGNTADDIDGDSGLQLWHAEHAERGIAVEGPLFAGNLVVLAALVGTPSMPSLRGHVVVIEEVGERPYRLDRLLTQLVNSGAFEGVVAVVVGHLTDCEEAVSSTTATTRDPAPSARDVVIERLRGLGVAVLGGLPAGHQAPNFALPLGGVVRVEVAAVSDGGGARLRWR